jgi:hypothetical protein
MNSVLPLQESFFPVYPDLVYRKQTRYILIATLESLVPLTGALDPNTYGGGTSEYTWGRVQQYFARDPAARRHQMPMHYYSEYLGAGDDYVIFVGLPLTNRSWFLQAAVAAGVLPIQYAEAILVVLQENYGLETIELRLWRILANSLLTPLMRIFDIPRRNILYFERLANKAAAEGPDWHYRLRSPTYLDPTQLDMILKEYEKR